MKDKSVRLVFALVCLCAWTTQAATADHTPAVSLVLELADGSRVIGTPSVDRLKMATGYASFEMPLSQLRTVEFSGSNHTVHVNLQNGDQLSVRLAATEIAVRTIFGQATIPVAQISKIQVSAIAPGGAGKPLPQGLVLHYTFDVNEGERVTDMSGAGNNGRVVGATYTPDGKIGGAMGFNGDREVVIVGNPASLQLQDFTIMAWIKRGSTTQVSINNEGGLFFGYGYGGYDLGMDPDGNYGLGKIGFGGSHSPFRIVDTLFHHVAVTKQGSQIVFYLDGVAAPGPPYDPGFEFNTDAGVGARADTLIDSFIGVIDEVMVFNRPLSTDEVKGIYDSQK